MKKLKIGKKSGLRYFGIYDIRDWQPCYNPSRYLKESWRGTAIDILENKQIPAKDRLWVVCRDEITNERTLRLFAVWCARQVQYLMNDQRSINALDVAERFVNGSATKEELAAARDAAGDAARDAAWDVAGIAAGAAAKADAGAAAKDVAWVAAWVAARAAARDAAGAAARDAAWVAAKDVAWDNQIAKLIKILKAEGQERQNKKNKENNYEKKSSS
jgi:hypothetical protein